MFKRYKNPFDDNDVELPTNGTGVATSPLMRPAVTPSSIPEPHRFVDEKGVPSAPLVSPAALLQSIRENHREDAMRQEKPLSVPPVGTKRSFTPPNLQTEEPDTTLGEGVVFKGQLTFKKLLRIDGHFEGELLSEGKLMVGPTGVVKANVKMREAVIEGVVEGNICVQERLELRSNARVIGDVEARLLSIDEGVTLLGHVCVKAD